MPLPIGIIWLSALVLPDDSPLGARPGWRILPGMVITGFILGFLHSSGMEVLQHTNLRLALALQRRLPLRLIGFLNHATRLTLLQRVGGGWVFIHRLLQEHLAATTNGRGNGQSGG